MYLEESKLGQSNQSGSSKVPFVSSEDSGAHQVKQGISEPECSSMTLPCFPGPIEPTPIDVDDSQVIVFITCYSSFYS